MQRYVVCQLLQQNRILLGCQHNFGVFTGFLKLILGLLIQMTWTLLPLSFPRPSALPPAACSLLPACPPITGAAVFSPPAPRTACRMAAMPTRHAVLALRSLHLFPAQAVLLWALPQCHICSFPFLNLLCPLLPHWQIWITAQKCYWELFQFLATDGSASRVCIDRLICESVQQGLLLEAAPQHAAWDPALSDSKPVWSL